MSDKYHDALAAWNAVQNDLESRVTQKRITSADGTEHLFDAFANGHIVWCLRHYMMDIDTPADVVPTNWLIAFLRAMKWLLSVYR